MFSLSEVNILLYRLHVGVLERSTECNKNTVSPKKKKNRTCVGIFFKVLNAFNFQNQAFNLHTQAFNLQNQAFNERRHVSIRVIDMISRLFFKTIVISATIYPPGPSPSYLSFSLCVRFCQVLLLLLNMGFTSVLPTRACRTGKWGGGGWL